MALKFLTTQDLQSGIFNSLLQERSGEDQDKILESIEAQNIAVIRSKISGRYDTDAIFSATGGDRHWLIIKILVKLTLYDFVRRNASRKVPDDYMKGWEWAMKTLENIKADKETPEGLPVPKDENGDEVGRIISGNNRNTNFYI